MQRTTAAMSFIAFLLSVILWSPESTPSSPFISFGGLGRLAGLAPGIVVWARRRG